ncbi:MAG: carboxymuconolactone decarboxylase family protein [Gammaproteobacteria bacterium]|nr:carboxymuconolactone decarboxylase family protein [Gammaproteobacteria bacterium]
MARISYPDPATLAPHDREFLADLPQLNVWRMLAGSPCVFQPMTAYSSAYLNDGQLSDEMREIVILRTGYLRDSEYEVVNHLRVAKLIGMDEAKVAALVPGQPRDAFTPEERDVLRFVDEVVLDGAASREAFDAVAASMSPAEMIELTIVIGVYTMVSQFCATFDIELEEAPIADTGIEDMQRAVLKNR